MTVRKPLGLLVLLAVLLLASGFGPACFGVLGDVDRDGDVDSSDALIVLSCDAGVSTRQFWVSMNCGDVNGDGLVNSTDAAIIMTYDAQFDVPYPLGAARCPKVVRPCAGLWR